MSERAAAASERFNSYSLARNIIIALSLFWACTFVSWHNIEALMAGELDEMVEQIRQAILEEMVAEDMKRA